MHIHGIVRVATDIELKDIGGHSHVSFRGAFDTGFGQKKQSNFMSFKAWGKSAELISQHFSKGKPIEIKDGEFSFEKWQAQDGSQREKAIVTINSFGFCPKNDGQGGQTQQESAYSQPQQAPYVPPPMPTFTPDDDIF